MDLEVTTAVFNCSNLSVDCLDDISSYAGEGPTMDPSIALFRDQSRFWVQRILVPLITLIGVVGNTITIVIMTRRRMRSSTNIYLAALAIFDMLYLVLILLLSFRHYPNTKGQEFYLYWRLFPFALMLTDTCSNTSVWLTVTFTIERYIAVGFPIRGKVLCTESRAKKVIIAVSLFCFTITLPTPFEWIILETKDEITNRTILMPAFSELGQNDLYKTIYYWMTVTLFVVIPFCLLAIFNAFLIRSVHLSKKARKSMTRRDDLRDSWRQENKITIMLIAVVMLFFICQLPTAVVLIYTSFRPIKPNIDEGALILGLGNIFNFLMAINAAGNFVLYCLLSQKYRRTFLQTFCPCLKGKITRLHSVYQNTVYSNMDSGGSPSVMRGNTVRLLQQQQQQRASVSRPNSRTPSCLDVCASDCSRTDGGRGQSAVLLDRLKVPDLKTGSNGLSDPSESTWNSAL